MPAVATGATWCTSCAEASRALRSTAIDRPSTIGIEAQVTPLGDRRALLPDGNERFVVDEEMLVGWTARLGGELLDPLKTTVVQGQRAMTTWVVRKR